MSTWLISFHGGSSKDSINNLMVFPESGSLAPALLPASTGVMPALSELRGLLMSPKMDTLHVVNAYKDFSQILKFVAADGSSQWSFDSVYASAPGTHPFDIEFAFNSNLYVSNQDANDVVFYTTAGAQPSAFSSGYSAVRGIAFDGDNYLYVADSGANLVSYLDRTGTIKGSFAVDQPVHLLYDGSRYVYIGSESGNSVLAWDTTGAIWPNPALVVLRSTNVLLTIPAAYFLVATIYTWPVAKAGRLSNSSSIFRRVPRRCPATRKSSFRTSQTIPNSSSN